MQLQSLQQKGGVSVAVFEKGATTGGTANMGMGLFAVENRHQRFRQMGPSRDEAFKVFMEFIHWRVDARLVRVYIDRSGDTIHWLENMGVEFLEPMAYFPGGWPTWYIVKPGGSPGCAANMCKAMTYKAKSLGVSFHFKTPAKRLIRKGNRIIGFIAETPEGEELLVRAGTVIIATGGFGDNPDWIKKYTGYEHEKDLITFRVSGLKGDGIRMAWEVGALSTPMNMQLIYIVPGEVHPKLAEAFRQPHLLVNLRGERFVNEGIIFNSTFIGNAISQQPKRIAFMIFDEKIKEHMKNVGLDFIHVPFPYFKVEDFDDSFFDSLKRCKETLFVANSISELAQKAGIDEKGLARQVEEYNEFCSCGFDPVFNKNHRYLRPIKNLLFMARSLCPHLTRAWEV